MSSLTQLYLHIVSGVVRYPMASMEALEQYPKRVFALDDLHRQMEALQKKLSAERQMNKRTEINKTIRHIQRQINQLKAC